MRTAIVLIIKKKSENTSDKSNHRPIALVTECSKIKPPPLIFVVAHLILELYYCAFGTFPKK